MPAPHQDEFPFASLEFPGRTSLYAHEVAERLGCTTQHVVDLIAEGALSAIDITGRGNSSDRRALRIPVEAYRDFVAARVTGARRRQLLAQLPLATLAQLDLEVRAIMGERSAASAQRS